MIRSLLLEKLSLRGISRVTKVSLSWLLNFVKEEYEKIPKDLNVIVPPDSLGLILERVEADEIWSFVGKKKNRAWASSRYLDKAGSGRICGRMRRRRC